MKLDNLTDEELALKARDDRDAEAVLFNRFWDLAGFIAKDFPIPGMEYEDRESIALQGLLKGIRTYNSERGTKVKTFVKMIIRRELTDAWRTVHQVSSIPAHALRSLDAQMGDGDDMTLADVLTDNDNPLGNAEALDEARRAWNEAAQNQWAELVDAINGEGSPEALDILASIRSFSKQVFPGEVTTAIEGLLDGQPNLYDDMASRGSESGFVAAKGVFIAYVTALREIVLMMTEGHQYGEIAEHLTLKLPGGTFTAAHVGSLVSQLRRSLGEADDELALAA